MSTHTMYFKLGLSFALCFIVGALAQTPAPGPRDVPPTPSLPSTPPSYKWNLNDTATGKVCIMFQAAVRFSFAYTNESNTTVAHEVDLLNPNYNSSTTEVSGSCGDSQNINIAFFEEKTWALNLHFTHVDTNNSWYMDKVSLAYTLKKGELPLPDIKNDTAGTAILENIHEFDTKVNKSYECESKQEFVNLTGQSVAVLEKITFRNMRVEAFRVMTTTTFSSPTTCPDDAVSNIVPIAVGAALGALVLIVLIAYLIGRRKSRRGYESV